MYLTPGAELKVTPVWGIFRSAGPAGLIHATAREVISFAQLHLADGVTGDGTRVLSAESAVRIASATGDVALVLRNPGR